MATRNYGLGSRDMKFAARLLLSKLDISFSSRSGIGDRWNVFVDWAKPQGVGYLAQLGKCHVIRFWEAHQALSDQTRYQYWLAFCELWRWLKKPGKPPRPFERTK
jgi:hypothetical protein